MIKIIIGSFLLLLLTYLYTGYIFFFKYIGIKDLANPNSQNIYFFTNAEEVKTPAETIPVYKYVAVGDSLTAGVGASSYEQTFPYKLAANLSKQKHNFELIILGQPGAKTDDILSQQLSQTIALKPDLITLLIGINDIYDHKSYGQFQQNYYQIIKTLSLETEAKIVVLNIPYLGSSKVIWFPYNLYYNYRTQGFNKIIKEFCYLPRVECIDLYDQTYAAFQQNPALYSSDLFHPSEKGYLLWTNSINVN